MNVVLWLCIVTAAGTCGVEKKIVYLNQVSCERALEKARFDASVLSAPVGSATSVEINGVSAPRVVALCQPK